jgi:hypothetical protein
MRFFFPLFPTLSLSLSLSDSRAPRCARSLLSLPSLSLSLSFLSAMQKDENGGSIRTRVPLCMFFYAGGERVEKPIFFVCLCHTSTRERERKRCEKNEREKQRERSFRNECEKSLSYMAYTSFCPPPRNKKNSKKKRERVPRI